MRGILLNLFLAAGAALHGSPLVAQTNQPVNPEERSRILSDYLNDRKEWTKVVPGVLICWPVKDSLSIAGLNISSLIERHLVTEVDTSCGANGPLKDDASLPLAVHVVTTRGDTAWVEAGRPFKVCQGLTERAALIRRPKSFNHRMQRPSPPWYERNRSDWHWELQSILLWPPISLGDCVMITPPKDSVSRLEHYSPPVPREWAQPDTSLLHHLIVDLDSVPQSLENTPSSHVYFDYRQLRLPGETTPDTMTGRDRLRAALILTAHRDTASIRRWGNCPYVLFPEGSRAACPSSTMVIYAFSDTFTLTPGQLGAAAEPQTVVSIDRMLIGPRGKNITNFIYAVRPTTDGWRTLSRRVTGVIE